MGDAAKCAGLFRKKLAEAQKFDPDDALLWVGSLPDTRLRTPAIRCFEEFVELWRLRFEQIYPEGLKIAAPKTTIKARYRAASGAFQAPIKKEFESLPDIGAISAPLKKLRELVDLTTEELDPYSRLLSKAALIGQRRILMIQCLDVIRRSCHVRQISIGGQRRAA